MPRPPASDPTPIRIGLWGGPGSGKTTYLAALRLAVNRQHSDDGDWIISGATPEASAFLGRVMSDFQERRFPESTADIRPLVWRFIRPNPRYGPLVRLLARLPMPGRAWARQQTPKIDFEISLLDVRGELYRNVRQEQDSTLDYEDEDEGLGAFSPSRLSTAEAVRTVEHMARCDGLVYLFDPVREREARDAYEFFARTLDELTRQAYDLGRMLDGKLPHYLAVCINKIDDPAVYRKARSGGFILPGVDESMPPEIPDRYAQEFFRMLCTGRDAGTAREVAGSIDHYFHPDRVTYYASSSIGYHIGPGGFFQPRDLANVREGPGGVKLIRGRVLPINVLEPFLWLEKQIRKRPPPPPTATATPEPQDMPSA